MKKAQVTVQFNWIFILIVGAIILAFFVTIAIRQKEASEQGVTANFFINFEKSLSGISAVEGKTLLFDIPKMDLRYDCNSVCDCAAYAGESRARAVIRPFSLNDKVIFSPNRLKGNNLLTISKEWDFPFRITNFLFMTSPEVKYLIENNSQGQIIYDDLPPLFIVKGQVRQRAIDKQLFTPGEDIEAITGNYKVKFVLFETDPIGLDIPSEIVSLANSDVTAVKIDGKIISFYEKDRVSSDAEFVKTGESYLFGDATLLAAVFAEDFRSYGCVMNRAFESLNAVAKVYQEKQSIYSKYVTGSTDGDPSCAIHYVGVAISNLVEDTEAFDFINPDPLTAESIAGNARTFETQNSNTLKSSCPHIY